MGESELLPNSTFFIQLGLFFICYFVLRKFVFVPYLALLDARRAKTSGLKEKAIQDTELAEKLKGQYEAFIRTERKKVNVLVEEERRKINDQERHVIQEARLRSSQELKQVRQKLVEGADKARKELEPLVLDFSSQIATKLVGRNIKVPSSSVEKNSHSATESLVSG